jgi:hypothetical protein
VLEGTKARVSGPRKNFDPIKHNFGIGIGSELSSLGSTALSIQ